MAQSSNQLCSCAERQFTTSRLLFFIVLACLSQHTNATISECFLKAETYYEQIYCEIKKQKRGKALPVFVDFKKNNEITQALLLKRDAAALNITIKMPERNIPKNKRTPQAQNFKKIATQNRQPCSFMNNMISCNTLKFFQVGNKTNSGLKKGVLESHNIIGLTSFNGKKSQQRKIQQYLDKSYVLYIEKMLEIGLGGVTMSFTKFSYLFNDLLEKNVDFASRFETMYRFLKKDKQQLAVSEKIPPANHLTIENCYLLTNQIYICDNRVRNYVYIKQ
jgi:hypothetical protein